MHRAKFRDELRQGARTAIASIACGTSAPSAWVLVLGVLGVLDGCSREAAPAVEDEAGRSDSVLLVEVTRDALPPEPETPWPDGRFSIFEITAGGLAVFDADQDGDLDLYQVRHPPPDRPEQAAPNRLFLNRGDGTFELPSRATGLEDAGYGSSVAVGDFDGDGRVDVFVGNAGRDALYRNRGDGTFEDVTAAAGVGGEGWSTGAAFFDSDNDGDLDLWVTRYLVNDPTRICRPVASGPRDYCGPHRYRSLPDRLWRNRGDGAFEDASQSAGIAVPRASLGLVCLDFTGDGWLDVYVANDQQPNQLWVNTRDGRFRDEAAERGVALNGMGATEASMGAAAADVNGDDFAEIFLTHLVNETSTLYQSTAAGRWEDRSASSGIGGPTLRHTGWGCGFTDLDLDGELDICLVNGRIARAPPLPGAERLGPFWSSYAEPGQVFLGRGDGRFVHASSQAGNFGSMPRLDRSLAFGDLDRDGDVDLVASDLANRLRIFRNDAPAPNAHWLRVRALDHGREALGAIVAVKAGARRQTRPLLRAYGYAASNEAVAQFGLGAIDAIDEIEVVWPGGKRERFPGSPVDREITIERGSSRSNAAPSARSPSER